MSFMSGFGEGFSRTFNQTLAAKEQRKQDAFRIMYSDFLSRKKKKEDYERNDTQNIKLAKTLVEGVPGLPEGAWLNAYQWLSGGLDQDTVVERLKSGQFNKPSELPAGEVNEATPTPMEQTPDPIEQTNSIFDRFKGGNEQERIQNQILSQISEMTGLSMDDITKTMQQDFASQVSPELMATAPEFVPGAIERDMPKSLAQAQLAYDRAVETGNKTLIESTKKDLESLKDSSVYDVREGQRLEQPIKILEARKKEIGEYNAAKSNMLSVIRHSGDLRNIVSTNPAVLADTVAGAATFATNLAQNFNAVKDIFNDPEDTKIMSTAKKKLSALEKEYEALEKSTVGKNIKNLETSRRLLNMKTQIMAYNLGMAYQQSGRAFAEAEREMFTEMAKGGTNPETFFQNLSVLVNGELARVEDMGNMINQDPSIEWYNKTFTDSPMEKPVTSVYDDIAEKPELQETMDFLDQYNNLNTESTEIGTSDIPSPQSKDEYDQLPSGTEYIAPDGSKRRKP